MNINIVRADVRNENHLNDILLLIDTYKQDEMGEGKPSTYQEKSRLNSLLKTYSNLLVLLAYADDRIAGGTVCFQTFATFSARPLINFHDLIVLPEYRNRGIGRRLLGEVQKIAASINCAKLTLEVRHDNAAAMHLYQSFGFTQTRPPMHFYVKKL